MANPEANEALFEKIAQRGQALYEQLRPQLEPAHDGKAVAIHLSSGAYVVAESLPAARREMHRKRPDGLLYSRTIGVEQDTYRMHRVLGRAQ